MSCWRRATPACGRVVYAASSSAYGNSVRLPKCESDPTLPLSPYAVAKLAGEQYCAAFSEVYGLETVRLRYFNVFGPRQTPDSPYAAVIPKFIEAMTSGRSPVIHGDGEQSRDFTFVADVVQANLLAAEAPGVSGKVYNIACGRRTSLSGTGGAAQYAAGHRHQADAHGGAARRRAAQPGEHQPGCEELGYEPTTDIATGLRRCLEWWRQRNETSPYSGGSQNRAVACELKCQCSPAHRADGGRGRPSADHSSRPRGWRIEAMRNAASIPERPGDAPPGPGVQLSANCATSAGGADRSECGTEFIHEVGEHLACFEAQRLRIAQHLGDGVKTGLHPRRSRRTEGVAPAWRTLLETNLGSALSLTESLHRARDSRKVGSRRMKGRRRLDGPQHSYESRHHGPFSSASPSHRRDLVCPSSRPPVPKRSIPCAA